MPFKKITRSYKSSSFKPFSVVCVDLYTKHPSYTLALVLGAYTDAGLWFGNQSEDRDNVDASYRLLASLFT